VPADSGRTLGLTVRATDSTGTATAYSSLFGPVAPPYPAVTSAAAPTLSGSARPGSTLNVDTGSGAHARERSRMPGAGATRTAASASRSRARRRRRTT
jgi:hypothetical protein